MPVPSKVRHRRIRPRLARNDAASLSLSLSIALHHGLCPLSPSAADEAYGTCEEWWNPPALWFDDENAVPIRAVEFASDKEDLAPIDLAFLSFYLAQQLRIQCLPNFRVAAPRRCLLKRSDCVGAPLVYTYPAPNSWRQPLFTVKSAASPRSGAWRC